MRGSVGNAQAQEHREDADLEADLAGARCYTGQTLFKGPVVEVGRYTADRHDACWSALNLANPAGQTVCLAFPSISFSIRFDGCEPFVATPCHVLMSNVRQAYTPSPLDDSGQSTDWIAYRHEDARSLLGDLSPAVFDRPPEQLFELNVAPCPARLYWQQRSLVAEIQRQDVPDALYIEEQACRILQCAATTWLESNDRPHWRRLARSSTQRAHREAVAAAVEYVSNNYHKPLTLAAIGRYVSVSPAHFCRIFRQATGYSVHGFVTQTRLAAALNLAPAYRGRTADLARELGFSSRSHLSAAFRGAFGVSLSEAVDVVATGNDAQRSPCPAIDGGTSVNTSSN